MGDAGRTYITLDDQTVLDAARSDPTGLIRGLDRVTIDEVQRAPDLLLAIKRTVDEDYRPGRFLLTGSANAMTLPRVADSLAGRIETIRMLPLARVEVAGGAQTFLERLFEGKLQGDREAVIGDDLVRLARSSSADQAQVSDMAGAGKAVVGGIETHPAEIRKSALDPGMRGAVRGAFVRAVGRTKEPGNITSRYPPGSCDGDHEVRVVLTDTRARGEHMFDGGLRGRAAGNIAQDTMKGPGELAGAPEWIASAFDAVAVGSLPSTRKA